MTAFLQGRRDAWKWTMMIVQSPAVTADLIDWAVADAGRKKDLPALGSLRFERFEEGLSAQIMHVGPYSEERPTIQGCMPSSPRRGTPVAGSTTRFTWAIRGARHRSGSELSSDSLSGRADRSSPLNSTGRRPRSSGPLRAQRKRDLAGSNGERDQNRKARHQIPHASRRYLLPQQCDGLVHPPP
jgi:hypothetical protein